jgi:hypothetical protein
MRWIPLLLSVLAITGCDRFAPTPAAPNPFDEAYAIHRSLIARVYWDASQQQFTSDKEARDWLAEHWKAAETEAWSRINRLEQKHLGEGRWNPDSARRLWRRLALAADPEVETLEPIDDLEDW